MDNGDLVLAIISLIGLAVAIGLIASDERRHSTKRRAPKGF